MEIKNKVSASFKTLVSKKATIWWVNFQKSPCFPVTTCSKNKVVPLTYTLQKKFFVVASIILYQNDIKLTKSVKFKAKKKYCNFSNYSNQCFSIETVINKTKSEFKSLSISKWSTT